MTYLKRFACILTAAVMSLPLYCCSDEKEEGSVSSETSEVSETSEIDLNEANEGGEESDDEPAAYIQQDIPTEYDGSEIDDACAQTISQYFTAIMNQDYDKYAETLNPYYLQVYDDWLDGAFGYGMETSFETMHQSVMDAACTLEDGTTVEVDTVYITKLALEPALPAEGEESLEEAIDAYLADYDAVIGEGFTEELKKQCDTLTAVRFTMTADCDGEERAIMTDMELLITITDGTYRILG
ncbi:MAG: hypothetical protein IJ512_05365 [Ruminococcus sp.]|nr:hypothetical protein [Ruminococcus sp.]